MLEWKFLRRVLSALLVMMAAMACSTVDKKNGGNSKAGDDIQERLSAIIGRNGFTHSLRSERDGGQHRDSVYISIPLDNLKRRHYSLENLLRDLGRVCAQPEYAALPIRVEFAAGDVSDRRYLQEQFLKEVGDKANISVSVESDLFDDILIMTAHPDPRAR